MSDSKDKKKKVNNPHDKFFRQTFSELEVARDYIQVFFPKEVKDLLDLTSLKPGNTAYITEQFFLYFKFFS